MSQATDFADTMNKHSRGRPEGFTGAMGGFRLTVLDTGECKVTFSPPRGASSEAVSFHIDPETAFLAGKWLQERYGPRP